MSVIAAKHAVDNNDVYKRAGACTRKHKHAYVRACMHIHTDLR